MEAEGGTGQDRTREGRGAAETANRRGEVRGVRGRVAMPRGDPRLYGGEAEVRMCHVGVLVSRGFFFA